jgi:hypothetical protein
MKQAFRGHYQPACIELIPGADPYIAELVVGALARIHYAGSSPTFAGRAAAPSRPALPRSERNLAQTVPYRSW